MGGVSPPLEGGSTAHLGDEEGVDLNAVGRRHRQRLPDLRTAQRRPPSVRVQQPAVGRCIARSQWGGGNT